MYKNHTEAFDNIAERYPKAMLNFCRDYNIPRVNWHIDDIAEDITEGAQIPQLEKIRDCFSILNMNQFNLVKNVNDVILDLVLSSQVRVSVHRSDFYLTNIDENHNIYCYK